VGARLCNGKQVTLEVGRKLGEGRSPVYEARYAGGRLALKISSPRTAEKEARILRAIGGGHKTLVRFLGVAPLGNDKQGTLMELVDGKPLGHHLRGQPRSPQDAVYITMSILRGLRSMHRRGYIHSDIAPHQIYQTAKGIKILDLGSAVEAGKPGGAGSWEYMPKEQFAVRDKRLLDPTADLYATAGVLVYLLTGNPPFAGDTNASADDYRASLVRAHSLGQVAFDPGALPRSLRGIIAKALAPERKDRYQTADAFLDALRPIHLQTAK
jgi:serine/threonine-protein kinase